MASAAPNSLAYQIIQIPTASPHLADFIVKFRNTKLAALQTSPSEWIYQYDSESIHALAVWESRFVRQNNIFVAVVPGEASLSKEEALLQGEWVAFVVIRGPIACEEYYAVPEMEQPVPDNPIAEARWHLYDLYTFPEYRRRGVARKLLEVSFAAAQNTKATLKVKDEAINKSRIRLFCNPKNTRLVDTYKRLGFQHSGRVSLREGLEANGMAESVPAKDAMSAEDFEKKFNTRIGIAMEKVLNIV